MERFGVLIEHRRRFIVIPQLVSAAIYCITRYYPAAVRTRARARARAGGQIYECDSGRIGGVIQ